VVDELVQIYSRGFTPGMIGAGRTGREYITRDHPDNRGLELGKVVEVRDDAVLIDTRRLVDAGDGLGFEPPPGQPGMAVGGTVIAATTLHERDGFTRQAVTIRAHPARGWLVFRTSDPALVRRARGSFADVEVQRQSSSMSVRLSGYEGAPLAAVFRVGETEVEVLSSTPLAPASKHELDEHTLRTQLGRLGETAYALDDVDLSSLSPGLFLPVSDLNRTRQEAVIAFDSAFETLRTTRLAERTARIATALDSVADSATLRIAPNTAGAAAFRLCADVYQLDDARAAARGGATEIAYDPFLRHPMPPVTRVKALASELREAGIVLRLRTPTVMRPAERRFVAKWLDLGLPLLSGHLGLVHELASQGRDVVADYAVNCFNQFTADALFSLGASRIVPSVELTVEELAELSAPWGGRNFDVVVYGRPEGMTIEHCVLSAAYDRVPTTCRDLCVQRHPYTELTDPAGYVFPVATDFACRNRLLHSRPIEASEFLPRLWKHGLRGFRLVCNVPDDPVEALASRWRAALDVLESGDDPAVASIRAVTGAAFTRGHFSRAV
jgi:putative protease